MKPTQAQFWDVWDSFWHKDEQIPQSKVENLSTDLQGKAEQAALQAHLADANAHPHGHVITDIQGLVLALDGKSDNGHTHDINDIDGLAGALEANGPTTDEWVDLETEQNITAIKNFLAGLTARGNVNFDLQNGQIAISTGDDGTASNNALTIANLVGGGFSVQKRGSTTIIAKGDSVTGYFILRGVDNALNTVFEVRAGGRTKGGDAVNNDEFTTLQQVNTLMATAGFKEVTFADIAARDAFDVPSLPFQAFVEDDGDGNWALYKATTTGVGATYIKISDPDLLNAVMTGSQIASAYENYSDVERFTTTLLNKLNDLPDSILGDVDEEANTLEKLYALLTQGYVTIGTEQVITGLKKFPSNGFRFVPDGGMGRKEVIIRSVSNSGPEVVQNVPILYINSNYDLAMTKGDLNGRGWKQTTNNTAFREYTWQDKDGIVAFLDDLDTPEDIVTKLSSIEDEADKLPGSAIQSSPYNPDHFEYDPVTGAFQVKKESTPAPGAKGFMSAEDIYAYEQANPRGSNFWDLSNLREARYTMDFTGRKGVVTGSSIIIIGSGGSSGNKGVVSFDLRHFTEFTTGWFDNYAIETAKGTTIIAGRESGAGTYMCKRSTDDGRNWNNITLPADSLPYDITSDGEGNWVIACRTTTAAAPNVLYSSDDGLTWAAGTVSDETLEYMGVICVDGQFLLFASLGTDKYQHSTNGGQTFAAATATGNSGHYPAFGIAHKGDMYISSNASGSHNRLLRSTDKGATLSGLSNGFDDVAIKSIASVGDYLYVASQGDGRLFRSKTGDTGDWEELTTGLANEITFITGGILHDTPIVIIGTGTAGERILINI